MRKIAYSLGAIATALSYQAFSAYIFFFYIDVVKLASGMVVSGMAVFAVWNAINDPIAGYISDRTVTPWGRRIPFIALGAVPLGVIYFLLWVPPFGPAQMLWLFSYFLAAICLFDLAYTVVVLNWASLYPEMFQTLKERAEVNSYRQAFGMMGLMLGVAAPPLLYGTLGWGWMGFMFGTLISAIFLITLLGSREKREFAAGNKLGLKEAMVYSFTSRPFLIFVLSNLFVQYAFIMVLASIPFFAKYILAARPEQISMILFAAFAAATAAMFAWGRVVVRFGAKHSYLAAISLLAFSLVPFFFAADLMACVLSAAFVGIGLAGIILISDILISDVIDDDEIRTGGRREGIYFGFNAFITRLAVAWQAGSIGLVFMLTGHDQSSAVQPAAFLSGIRFLIAGLPILSLIIAFTVMAFYPLSGEPLKRMRDKLEAMHELKGKKGR